jgi:hypothetical protein
MTISQGKVNHHWNYFLALENDVEQLARYIQFHKDNYRVYSIELVRLLFAASSEFEVVAKMLCEQLAPNAPQSNIDHYRAVLKTYLPGVIEETVSIPKYGNMQLR